MPRVLSKKLDTDLLKRLVAGEPSKFKVWHSLKAGTDKYKYKTLKNMLDRVPAESVVGMQDGLNDLGAIADCCRWYLRAAFVCEEATAEQLVDFAIHRTNVAHDVQKNMAARRAKARTVSAV